MGQKVNPVGFRLGINRTWDSRWFANRREYGKLLHEDMKIRNYLKEQLKQPLSKTLTLSKPPLPSEATNLEPSIDKLTLKNVFSYELQGLPTGGAAMILDPTS